MGTTHPPDKNHCPTCGKPVDKLRAGAIAIYETKMVYFCSEKCKAEHDGRNQPSQIEPREESTEDYDRLSTPDRARETSDSQKIEPDDEPAPIDQEDPRFESPDELEDEGTEPTYEEIPAVERQSSLYPDRATKEWSIVAEKGQMFYFLFGLALFVVSLISSRISSDQTTFVIQLGASVISLFLLTAGAILTVKRRGFRAGWEEILVSIAAFATVGGYFHIDDVDILIATPGIAAFTWFGRWLEASGRRKLALRFQTHIYSQAEFRSFNHKIWGDSHSVAEAPRGWSGKSDRVSSGFPLELETSELLLRAVALQGEGASATAKIISKSSMIVGIIALPIGVITTLLLIYSGQIQEAYIVGPACLMLLSPRVLRRSWVGPMLLASGMGVQRGLCFRDGRALEATGRSHRVVFDSRGTLTRGDPEVSDIVRVGNISEDEILALAAGVEMAVGDDPLGKSIVKAAEEKNIEPTEVRLSRRRPGFGMSATCNKGDLLVGTRQLILGEGISVAEADEVASEMESLGQTVVFVALGGRIQGVIGIKDDLRKTAQNVAPSLSKLGVEPVMMTGDSRQTADALGKKLGFEHVKAELSPDQWPEKVRDLRETDHGIAMVTCPPRHTDTLEAADVGITLGDSCFEIETAGAVLKGSDPTLAVQAVSLAREAYRAIWFNVGIAIVFLVIVPGLFSLYKFFLPQISNFAWIVPPIAALFAAIVPAILSSEFLSTPRGGRRRTDEKAQIG